LGVELARIHAVCSGSGMRRLSQMSPARTTGVASPVASAPGARVVTMTEQDFLQAILDHPERGGETWLVLADWLEDRGDPRWELVRLQHDREYWSRACSSAGDRDDRIRQLLASG